MQGACLTRGCHCVQRVWQESVVHAEMQHTNLIPDLIAIFFELILGTWMYGSLIHILQVLMCVCA